MSDRRTVAEGASRRFTVVEVQAADRAGLLAALARAIHEAGRALLRDWGMLPPVGEEWVDRV